MTASSVITVIPMKPLSDAKSRLAAILESAQRIALVENLLRRVLRVVKGASVSDIWVVGGDPRVCRLALEWGVTWLEEGSGLNQTLRWAFRNAFGLGKAALYLPGDLPFLETGDVHGMVAASGSLREIVLAPARQGGGTNGILAPQGTPLRPSLGPGSFKRHLCQARSQGLSAVIYESPGLGYDLDTVDDVEACERVEPGLLAKLTT
jgi:2-phospho-L-lactate guanylyltransferase